MTMSKMSSLRSSVRTGISREMATVHHLATRSRALERCLHVIGEPAQSDTTSSTLTVSLNQTFRPYACLYWPMHLRRIEGRGMDDNLTEKLFRFLFEPSSTSQGFAKWIPTLDKLSDTLQWNDQLKKCDRCPHIPINAKVNCRLRRI